MQIPFLALITFLSATPPAVVFVESASFRGLMNKLSSGTIANSNNDNNNPNPQDNIDEVVHVDLDPHDIALAETTDVHPHLATSDPEQGDRHLSACTPAAATEWYTPRDLPACCTEKAWHPTYAAGWTGGYCQFTTDCNSPSYSSEVACCNGAYRGQRGNNCLNSLPSPPTGSPTDLGEGVYYPDYGTDWVDATCKNDRPWPFGPGDRPTYTNMKDCCDNAYAGQISKACITAYYESFPDPPTGSPTDVGETNGGFYPDYDLLWVDGFCINTKPIPSGRPTYISMLSCCQAAYAGQTSQACMEKYYESFPNPPTGSPTDLGEGQYYPDYETKWEDATCINTKPFPSPGSRPMYNSQLECCKLAYAGQTSKACLAGLPEGLRPTSSPTGPGGSWYNNENDGDGAVRVCTNETPKPQWGVSKSYDSKLECCNGALPWQFSKACYCWATRCDSTSGIDVCVGGDELSPEVSVRNLVADIPFEANVGCESCSGTAACAAATGSIGNVGNPGCKDCASCVGEFACTNFGLKFSAPAFTAGYDINVFEKKGGSSIGTSSCIDLASCYQASGKIGDNSCIGSESCISQRGTIGDKSCTTVHSCLVNSGTIGDRSCTVGDSCRGQSGIIGNDSCNDENSCQLGGNGQSGTIGNDSCNGKESCSRNSGKIGNGSCNLENACSNPDLENNGLNASNNVKDIGNGSCNNKDACSDLKVNVGNNSCNRSAGCNACTAGTDVSDNMCNGGTNDVCPETCG